MLRVFEAFAGYGSQRMALRNIGIDHEVVAISEIDKYAIMAYNAVHGEVNNLGDISMIDVNDVPDHDLFTYSFPCQDISSAGHQRGFSANSGTRSSLLWECQKIIEAKKPTYLLMENVKALLNRKNKNDFQIWIDWLNNQGYSNFYSILNSEHYNVPQNRERVFVVSILGNKTYTFPEPKPLTNKITNILDTNVDKKYFLSSERMEYMKRHTPLSIRMDVSPTLTTELSHHSGKHFCPKWIKLINQNRVPTEKEAFRLMGVNENDITMILNANIPKTQLYKMAGNSIVVPVLEHIFTSLFQHTS